MAEEIILQNFLFTRFLFPFLLVFFLVFAILEKTKIFGGDKKSLNAWTAFVIGMIVVAVAYPTQVINNLILFLTVALVTMFVALLLWGFAIGSEPKFDSGKLKWASLTVVLIAVVIATFWATGTLDEVIDWLFGQDWSSSVWVNTFFVLAVAGALAIVLRSGGKGK